MLYNVILVQLKQKCTQLCLKPPTNVKQERPIGSYVMSGIHFNRHKNSNGSENQSR